MAKYTNSEVVTVNEDGSITTKIEYTELPATKKEKAAAWTVLGAMTLVSLAPVWWSVRDEIKWRREERKRNEAHEKRLQDIKDAFKVD